MPTTADYEPFNYPQLDTERLTLRGLRMSDADFILCEWGDPRVTYYLRDEDLLRTREQAEALLRRLQDPERSKTFRWWGMELKADGVLVGSIGYPAWDKRHHRAEVAYDLWPDYWGRGLMSEALRAVVEHGFTVLDLNRIEATTHTENRSSQRVLEKLGFQREGILREYYCRGGIYNDQVQFSLLRREWTAVDEGQPARSQN